MRRRTLPVIALAAALLTPAVPAAAGPASVTPLVLANGASPFASCTIGGPGNLFVNAETEPFVAVNPTNPQNLIGVVQQDRWSNGGAHGLSPSSFDGGHDLDHVLRRTSAPAPAARPQTAATTTAPPIRGSASGPTASPTR